METITETYLGIVVAKDGDGSYTINNEGWKHTDLSAEDVMRYLMVYINDRDRKLARADKAMKAYAASSCEDRSKKFARARERLRELRHSGMIRGFHVVSGYVGVYQQIFTFSKDEKCIYTQDGEGGVRLLTFSEIRRLLTEVSIPTL